MLAVRPEWTIQKWIADARAHGTTDAERDLYGSNAKNSDNHLGQRAERACCFGCAWKEWAGLIGSYHIPRWEKFFAMLDEKAKEGFDYPAYEDTLPVFENRIIWHADDFYTRARRLGGCVGGRAPSLSSCPRSSLTMFSR